MPRSTAGGGPVDGADDVTYTQFMGKDNVPFHTLGFPATLLGSGEDWKLVDRLKSFNWLTYYGGKFSTSERRGVFMSDALDLLPADYWRWYLMANAPESDDASFTWELFGDCGQQGPRRHLRQLRQPHGDPGRPALRRRRARRRRARGPGGRARPAGRASASRSTSTHLDELQFRKATAALRALWAEGNVYLEEREPWRTVKVDRDRTACTLRHALAMVAVCAVASEPFVPDASARLRSAFPSVDWPSVRLDRSLAASPLITAGDAVAAPGLLFQKLTVEQLAEWEQRFGGAPESAEVAS